MNCTNANGTSYADTEKAVFYYPPMNARYMNNSVTIYKIINYKSGLGSLSLNSFIICTIKSIFLAVILFRLFCHLYGKLSYFLQARVLRACFLLYLKWIKERFAIVEQVKLSYLSSYYLYDPFPISLLCFYLRLRNSRLTRELNNQKCHKGNKEGEKHNEYQSVKR